MKNVGGMWQQLGNIFAPIFSSVRILPETLPDAVKQCTPAFSFLAMTVLSISETIAAHHRTSE